MKKGFIEMIEDGKVVVIYEDYSKDIFEASVFPQDIQIDMNVCIEGGKVIDISPPSEALKKEIEELTKRIFVPFSERKKGKK